MPCRYIALVFTICSRMSLELDSKPRWCMCVGDIMLLTWCGKQVPIPFRDEVMKGLYTGIISQDCLKSGCTNSS